MITKENARLLGSRGGRSTVQRHGREHMVAIGRRGFDTTTQRHFGGDENRHKEWLGEMGVHQYWLQSSLPATGKHAWHKRPIHPAHVSDIPEVS